MNVISISKEPIFFCRDLCGELQLRNMQTLNGLVWHECSFTIHTHKQGNDWLSEWCVELQLQDVIPGKRNNLPKTSRGLLEVSVVGLPVCLVVSAFTFAQYTTFLMCVCMCVSIGLTQRSNKHVALSNDSFTVTMWIKWERKCENDFSQHHHQ